MLDKLMKLEIIPKHIDSIEYWIEELQTYDKEYELNRQLKYLQLKNDSYIEYVMNLSKSDNIHLEAVRNLFKNQEVIRLKQVNFTNSISDIFVRTIPYAMIELFKLCSALFEFKRSSECWSLRNMTLSDSQYKTQFNTRVMLSQDRASDLGIISVEEVMNFWSGIDDMRQLKGSYSHMSLCGDWKATDDEDLVSRHVLQLYNDDLMKSVVTNGTFRELCRSCSSLCGPTSRVYMDWFIESITLDPLADLIYSIGLLVSVVFLILTLLVFCIVPRLHKPLHGKCTVFHLISMVTAYISLSVPQLTPNLTKVNHPTYCVINGYLVQYGFLAMFFWLNVLCFDILYAFSFPAKKSNQRKGDNTERTKLFWYCCYGWGGPLVIMSWTILMEYSFSLSDEDVFKPNIGGPKCFFQNVKSQWIYLYGPIGCLILANLIMFTATAFNIYQRTKETELLKSSDNATFNKGNSNRLKVYLNLFILMGANWTAELLSWILPNKEVIKYLLDATTALQGLLVFVLLVCKPRVLKDLRYRLKSLYQSEQEPNPFQISISSNKSSGQTTSD